MLQFKTRCTAVGMKRAGVDARLKALRPSTSNALPSHVRHAREAAADKRPGLLFLLEGVDLGI